MYVVNVMILQRKGNCFERSPVEPAPPKRGVMFVAVAQW